MTTTTYTRVYPYALEAARDAVSLHEGRLEFYDALRTAAGLYMSSWMDAQRARGRNPVPREKFPTSASRDLFRYNLSLQSVLMERDPFMWEVDAYLRQVLDDEITKCRSQGTIFTFRKLLRLFCEFARLRDQGHTPFYVVLKIPSTSGNLRYKNQKVTFPSQRAWGAFAASHSLWCSMPCAPQCSDQQLYSFSRNELRSSREVCDNLK